MPSTHPATTMVMDLLARTHMTYPKTATSPVTTTFCPCGTAPPPRSRSLIANELPDTQKRPCPLPLPPPKFSRWMAHWWHTECSLAAYLLTNLLNLYIFSFFFTITIIIRNPVWFLARMLSHSHKCQKSLFAITLTWHLSMTVICKHLVFKGVVLAMCSFDIILIDMCSTFIPLIGYWCKLPSKTLCKKKLINLKLFL